MEQSLVNGQESTSSLIAFIGQMGKETEEIKLQYKLSLLEVTSVLSVTFYMLTYGAQFVTSGFYTQFVHWTYNNVLLNVLFVLGISVDSQISIWRQMYFYYLMIFMTLLQKLFLSFLANRKQQEAQASEEEKTEENVRKKSEESSRSEEDDPVAAFIIPEGDL